MATDNKRKLYDALSQDYDMGSYEQFCADLNDEDKRRKLYDATSQDYDLGSWDSFSQQLGYGQAAAPAPERSAAPVDTLSSPTPEPSSPKATKYFKLRRGGKDFTVSTDEVNSAGGLSSWAQAHPGAPVRVYMQGKKEDGTDFDGHVDLSVAHDRSKRRGYKYTTTSEAIEDKPWQPTEKEKIAISMQLHKIQAQTEAMFDETREHMENVSEYYRNNRSLGFHTVESKPVLNPQTGKMEKTYLTPMGDRTTSKVAADMSTFNFGQSIAAADMSVGAQIRRAEAELAELRKQYEDSKGRVHDEWAEDYENNDAPLAAVLAANTYVPRQMSDKENSALRVAIRQREEQLKDLYEERDRQIGKDVGFWRGLGRVVSDSRTWDFGTGDLLDAMTMLNADQYSAPNATEGEKRSGQKMLKAVHDAQQTEQMFGENASFWNRAGVMTGYMPSFMLDFALTGGGYEVLDVAGKAAARGSVKLIGEAAIKEMTELGVKAYAKKYGLRGVGRMAENWTIKALGTTADDLLIRAPLMTNTVQAGKTAADIIDRKLGDVQVDSNGNYNFANDRTWGSAVWQGEANAIIENYSEMFGTHLDGVVPALAKTFGGKRISGMLARANASSYGQILATTRKQFERLGVSDYFGEVSEEYYGLLWRTMLNLDDAYTNVPVYDEQGNQVLDAQGNPVYERKNLLFTGKFHGDIWGGMALSMGLMGAGKYTISGIAYGNMKHQVNVADRVAAEIFTPERWEPIREIIDNTTNDDIGTLAESMVNDPNLSDEERVAVMEYMERSLNLRGLNLGAMAQSRGAEDEESVELPTPVELDMDNEFSQSYIDGYEASSPQEMADTQNMYEYQRQRVEGMFEPSVLESFDSNPVATLIDMSQTGLYSQEEIDAARDYINAKTVRDGILQRVNDNIDEQIAQSDAMINARVNPASGMIQPAVMGLDDRQVYVVGGSLAINPDGTIDREASDESIVVRDAVTGEVEFADPKSIASAGKAIDPEMEKAIAVDNIRQQAAQAAADALNGVLPLNPGDMVQINHGGGLVQVTVIGPIVDEESGMPIEGQVMVQYPNGQQTPFTKEQLQAFADSANLERINDFEQQRGAERAQRQATEAEVLRPQFALNDEFTILNDNGTPIRGSITAELDEDGTVEIHTEGPINGNHVNRFTPAELEEMFDTYNEQPVSMPEPATEHVAETGNNDTEIIQVGAQATAHKQSALSRIPVDEQGRRNYLETDADTAYDAFVELSQGDEALAAEVIADYVDEAEEDFYAAEKVLTKTKESKPEKRKKGNPSPTDEERVAIKRAAKEALAEAQAIRDRAKAALDHWKSIAGTKQRRENERRSAEDAEAHRRAAERAAEEARLRAEREEAERIEREALNGVPDWNVDTPADARARGYRRNGPQKVDRPEIIDNHAIGNSVEVKFGDDVMPTGNIAIIEASQLQPSHRDGQRNPYHFLDEAQPKERKDAASRFAASKIAETIRPEEITSSVTAFTGAPSVNSRGEVIQGNNRSEALRIMYENYADSATKYKQYLLDHAAEFGLTPEAIEAFGQPVLVNMLDVSDENAITLGQYVAQDTESGGIERIKPKNAVQKMGDKIRNFANLLLCSADDEASFAQLVDANGVDVLKWMNQQGFISNTQYASAFDSKGNLSAEAANDLKGIMYQSIFTGGSTRLEEMFNKMPAKAQRAILATAFRDYDSAFADRMVSGIQQSIIAFNALSGYEQFRDATNPEAVQYAVEAWKQQYAFDDVSGDPYLPSETFSNFALTLAAMYKGHTQRHIQSVFNMMYDIVQGTEQDNLFEAADKTPKPLAEAIRRVLNLEYQPIVKPTTDNGTNESTVLDIDSEDGQDGRPGSSGNTDSAEQNPQSAEPTNSGTGTASDSGQGGEVATEEATDNATEQHDFDDLDDSALAERIDVADDDWTDGEGQTPTYKRTITIDGKHKIIQIDEPDGNGFYTGSRFEYQGEQFGSLTEIIDHIDKQAKLAADIAAAEAEVNTDPSPAQKKAGNYKKGHVPVGTFDVTIEQPVGSVRRGIDADGKEWETTMQNTYGYIRGTQSVDGDHIDVFLSTDIDAWNGRKVFIVDQYNPDDTFDEHKVMLGFNDHDEAINAYLANYEDGWEKGRRLVFSSATLEDFEKWIESSHRKQKPYHEYKIADKAEVKESTPENPISTADGYTIDTYTTKKNKTYHRVVFPRADKAVWQERLNLAKKMGGTSVPKGYGFKTQEETEAFAKAVADPATVADAQPLSLDDMRSSIEATPTATTTEAEQVTETDTQQPEADKPVNPSGNKLVTDERYAELRERMRKKLDGQFNMGVDPEILAIGTEMAVYHIEKGTRKFTAYASAMIADLGDAIRPYLKSFYNAVRDMPEAEAAGLVADMDSYDEVRSVDIANIDKPGADAMATAAAVVAEQEAEKQREEADAQLKEKRKKRSSKKEPKSAVESVLFASPEDTVPKYSGEVTLKDGQKAVIIYVTRTGEIVPGVSSTPGVLEYHAQTRDSKWVTFNDDEVLDETRPAADLMGDSAAYQEKEIQTVALVEEIGSAISNRVAMLQLDSESVKPLTMTDVKKMASKYRALKEISVTDLQELVELAMTQLTRSEAIVNINGTAKQQRSAYDHIVNLYQIQPNLNARDSERLIKQQYSTPTPFGFVMGQFVRAGGKEVGSMLEPSAGNGALTITVHPSNIHVNDIDDARLANLRKLGYGQVTAQDALLPFSGDKVDVVMTNPPFGTVTEKVYDAVFRISSLEGQMAINALEKMKDDGRAAIVIGGNTSYRTNGSMNPKDAAFFGYLYSHYNVADVINISGKALYSRNGTGYDVRMILIDGRKTGEFQRVYPPVRAKARAEQVTTFDELYKRVQDDIQQIQQMGSQFADVQRDPETAADGTASAPVRSGNNRPYTGAGQRPGTTGDAVRDTPRTDSGQPSPANDGGRPVGVDNAESGNAGSIDNVPRPAPQQPRSVGSGSTQNGTGRSGGDGRGAATSRSDRSAERLEVKPDLTTEKVPYPNQSDNGFTLMSVVPAAQAQVLQKSLGEIGDVDQYLVDELGYSSKQELYSYLAAEQIDSVALAIHQMNKGNAFIIGDMTGVGKGRQGAALIRYAVMQGKVPIYFTQKPTLYTDNYRDLCDIGSSDLRPFIIASNAKDANIVDADGNVVHKLPSKKEQERVFKYIMEHGTLPDEYDYVLTTYDQIKNGTADYEQNEDGTWNTVARKHPKKSKGYTTADTNGQTRRDALARLAEGNITILDESHTVGGDSGCGRYMQMLTSQAGGVTFLSATFAKRADNMPIYAQRTAIAEAGVKASELIDAIMKGGVTLQEIMSKQLVESGQMIRRERSFEGVSIDWLNVEDETNARQRAQFNEVAEIFNAIRNFQNDYIKPIISDMNDDAASTGGVVDVTRGTESMGVKNVPFASKMYNLVNQLLFALKVDAVADRVVENLRNGYKPVISFTNTMEGFLSSAPKGVAMDDVPNFSLTLMRALEGVMRYTEKDADENSEGGQISLSQLSTEGHNAYNAIRDKIMNLSADLPISPMDAIRMKIEDAGYSVAEITGRTMQLNRTDDGRYIVEARKDRDKKAAMRDFNSGKLDVLMINKSGSTGISLHASSKFEDQRPRVMVFAQFQSDINDEVQMRGRIDRSGQVTRGRYEYIMSTIPAEQRIQMMFKAKLKSLDANTTSSQKSKFNEMEIVDYLNKYGDEVVWEYMKEHPELEERLGDPLDMLQEKKDDDGPRTSEKEDTSKKTGCAGKISRYLAFLSVEEQDEIFREITEAYSVKIQLLDDAGENDLEITTMPLRAETKRKQIWHEGENPGSGNAFADNTYVEEVEVDVLKKPMKRTEIEDMTRKLMGDKLSTSTEYDQQRYDMKDGELNWGRYADKMIDEINNFFGAKADDAVEKMKEAGEKRITKVYNNTVRYLLKGGEKGEHDYTFKEIEDIAHDATVEVRTVEKRKQDRRREEINSVRDRITSLLTNLRAGGIYVVPQDLKQGTAEMFSQTFGTFVGFKFNKSYTLGSSTAIFATLDGRRKVELALSDPAIQTIIQATNIAYRYSPKEINAISMNNWDSKVPTQTRQKRYIITGNLLQALVDTEKGEKTRGNLISYSTIDGETHQGILMGENFKLTDLRNSASLSSRLTQIREGKAVVSENGDVQIEKVTFGWQHRGQYELRVPKSKQRGGVYSMHPDLLNLVEGHNFITKGNNMVAYINEVDLAKVVDMLSRAPFNLTVLQESQLSDVEAEDDVLYRANYTIDDIISAKDMAKLEEADRMAVAEYVSKMPCVKMTVLANSEDVNAEGDLSDEAKVVLLSMLEAGGISGAYSYENKKIYIFANGRQGEEIAFTIQSTLIHENAHHLADTIAEVDSSYLDRFAEAVKLMPSKFLRNLHETLLSVGYDKSELSEEIFAMTLQWLFQKPKSIERLKGLLSESDANIFENIITKQYGEEGRYKETIIDGFKHKTSEEAKADGLKRSVGEDGEVLGREGGQFGRRERDGSEVVYRQGDSAYGDDVLCRPVTDKATLERLNSEPTIKVYRAMQMIDGGLRPPMSAKVDGQLRDATEVGVWEEAEEHPEMADENGRFKLDKGNGKSIKAAYNPYIHTSRSPINDQFSSAWSRPELVTVEVEVPVSELTSEYHAEKAKDTVGEKEWKSGPVSRALAKIGQARRVILSRWSRVVRVVPVEEVAEAYAQRLNAHGIEVPFNTVPPALRDALFERGVKIGKPEKGNAGDASLPAFEQWISEQERQRMGDGYGAYSDAEVSFANDSVSKVLGKNRFSKKRQAEFAARERQRMVARIQELAERMHLDNVEILTDASGLEGKRAKAKGFYDKRTGKITIVVPNNYSTIDAEQTLLHEAVAHYGLRQLFGAQFDTFLDNVYEAADEEIRRKIAEMAAKNGWNFRTATEEYLAGLAEDTNFSESQSYTGWWSMIKRLFLDMLDKIGFEGFRDKTGVLITDNELRYILWRSYENLAEPGRYRSILGDATDVAKQSELKVGNYAEQDVEAEYAAEDGDLFRPGDFSPRDTAFARSWYNRMVSTGTYQFKEAVQDSMLGLKTLYQAILGKKTRIENVAGFENAYLFENRMSSMNAGEQHEYFQSYMQPLLKEIGNIVGANKRMRQELTDYLMAKHGLERNAYMRSAATSNGEDTERDFAGLMGLTGEADWQTAEDTAQQWVDDYEAMHDTTALWDAINAATKATLEKVYLSGVISKETYEKIRDMYDFYIPLRGWDETTSDEVYGYLTSKDGPLGGSIMKKAEGRESKADDPIATIGMMADAAIRQGNRNLMKQRFLNFILNHPSDAVSVHDIWLEYDVVTDEWRPVFADVEETDTADEVAQKVETFEQRMEALRTADPDKYKKGREAQHIPYKVVRGNLREHQILIKRNGHTFVATINGNPRAAQAINGLTNPDVDQTGVVGNMLKAGTWVNRQLSAFYTTRNPDFVVSNFFRDLLYSNCMTWVKESPRYARRFHRNFGRVNPVVMRRLLGKWENGTLNRGNRLEDLFYLFMKNGGETGYTNVKDIDGHKRTIAAELKKQGSTGRRAWTALGMQLDLLNRSAENCARFAAFVTSRDFGRSIDRAIYDAKEISVNFNKKGCGGKMVNATGQTSLGKLGSYLGGGGRIMYVFWNAGIQGMTNCARQAKLHPAKFTTGAAVLFALGYVIPLLAQMLAGGDGDDDKNAYYNLPEYVRRSNICFYAGDQWITIPLPIEYRAMYGMGELAHGAISGNERYSNSELTRQMAAQISQIMPLDMLEGGGGVSPFIPSAFKPFTEAYIMNKGWTGLPVYKDTPFNKNDPEWTKAYASADKHLVDFARWLNETSGGDDFKKGSIDINPAKIEYLLNGTFGGLFTFPNKLKKSKEAAFGDRDFEWRNMPIANRLIKSGDERTANRKLQNEYFMYKKEYEEIGERMRKYENADEQGVMGYAERIDLLENSPEYARWEIFDVFKADLDSYREELAAETDKEERKRIEAEMYAVMRELVNALHDPEAYHNSEQE